VCEKCGAAQSVQSKPDEPVATRRRLNPAFFIFWGSLCLLTLVGFGLLWRKQHPQSGAAQSEANQTRVVSVNNPVIYTVAPDDNRDSKSSATQAPTRDSAPQASARNLSADRKQDQGPVPVKGRVEIPPAVAAKLLVTRVAPEYPPVAKGAGVHGTVVLMAVIGKDGRVKTLEYYDGPQMLADAAMAAVFHWVYRPYLYKGEPVEMDTAIAVEFKAKPE
jgi:outer membrane biosynthesis protein TonB